MNRARRRPAAHTRSDADVATVVSPRLSTVRRRCLLVVATGSVVLMTASGCTPGTGSPSERDPAASAGSDVSTTTRPTGPVSPARLEAFGEQLLVDTGSTGGIVAVTSRGAAPVVVAVGAESTADGTPGEPIDPESPLDVASVTKSYVAALALVLAADGVVDLDAPIGVWIDWPGGDRITLRHLLTHTSGLGRFGDGESPSPFLDLVARGEPVDLDEVLAAARDVAPIGEPGGGTRYGNLNYALAGAVLEAAADQPLADLFRSRLFAPLNLDDTSYPPAIPEGTTSPVGLYEFDAGVAPIVTTAISLDAWRTALGPASGAMSTVDDLLAWSDAVFRRGRVGDVDLSAMRAIGPGGYGIGVIGVGPEGDCIFDGCPPDVSFDRWALNGDFPGASTRVLYDPATDTTLVVYLNRNSLDLDPALIGFLDQI